MEVKCPQCGSLEVNETDEFDLTVIDKDECHHDFKCDDCNSLFYIIYFPVDVVLVKRGDQ